MVLPLVILAVPSIVIGWLGRDFFLTRMLPAASEALPAAAHHAGFPWLVVIATALALLGIGAGLYLYGLRRWTAGYPDDRAPWLYQILRDKLYVDEVYEFLIRRVGSRFVITPTDWAERKVVNESFDQAGGSMRWMATLLARFQSGQVQLYMGTALLGLLMYAAFFGGRP
jgi:NADH:ubiquinone oxidoreductase subunit 5 (subunit L)/multisubunit Na+/H+ antiporter MnhA subunit